MPTLDKKQDQKRKNEVAFREEIQTRKPSLAELIDPDQAPVLSGSVFIVKQLMAEIKKLRQSQGLTLEAVSTLSGIDIAMLSRLETGKMLNPTMETIYRIATAVGKEPAITWGEIKNKEAYSVKEQVKVREALKQPGKLK
jgi:hypothetical protein